MAAVKDEVEKMLKANFIYLIALMEWVSNPIPIDKKQGTIHICTNFRDVNKACPKENYPVDVLVTLECIHPYILCIEP